MPVLQPRKEQVGTVCQPEKVLGQRRAVNDGMAVAVVGTAAAAAVAAAAAPLEKPRRPVRRRCCLPRLLFRWGNFLSPKLGGVIVSLTGLLLL